MITWLREHWEIKVIALVMAVTLYFFIGGVTVFEQPYTIRVRDADVVGLPQNYRISGVNPRAFTVVLQAPRSLLEDLDAEDIRPRLEIDVERLAKGYQEFVITGRLLQLSPEMRVVSHDAESIQVMVARIEEDRLTIDPAAIRVDNLPPGLEVREIRLTGLQQLRLRGPRDALDRMLADEAVPLRPIDLAGQVPSDLAESMDITVSLAVHKEPGVEMIGRDQITATVRLGPEPARKVLALPVSILAPQHFGDRYVVEINPPQVAVSIAGPRNRLEAVDLAEVVEVYVDLTGRPTLDVLEAQPFKVITPSWATAEQGQVQVMVRLRADQNEP